MRKLYDKIFNTKFFKKIMTVPFFNTLLSYEVLSYLFFGVMTTVVNFVVFGLADKVLGNKELFAFSLFSYSFKVTFEDVSTFIAWFFAVIFAYVTNKLWVFESKSRKPSVVIRELLSFFGARIISFILFESLGFMLVRNIFLNLGMGENAAKWIGKILMAVVNVIFNYIASKLVVFKNKKKDTEVNSDES